MNSREGCEGITLTWNKICCFVSNKQGAKYDGNAAKQILYDVSGYAKPGDLLAVLGASGAGKSTLMNILTCRNLSSLKVDGIVKVNGKIVGADIKNVSAYVQQDDSFWNQLTVREHLWLQSLLRMQISTTECERESRVNDVIKDMRLSECADDLIFDVKAKAGISGSERKLLSFASELLTDPSVMLCDEPTSGLDSLMAETVISALRDLTIRGKTVVCTIHQPSSNIFALFGRVKLMAEGRVAFFGSREEVRDFFELSKLPCPPKYNPADHYIHCLAIRPGEENRCRKRVEFFCDSYQCSKPFMHNQVELEKLEQISHESIVINRPLKETTYKSSWWTQLKAITWRHWKLTIRNPALFSMRVIQAAIYTVCVILVYHNPKMNQATVRNLNGATFDVIIAMTFMAENQMNSMLSEHSLFMRDHSNGLYRTDTYFIARNVVDIPVFLMILLTVIIPIYWLLGYYPDFPTFLMSVLVLGLVYQISISLNVYFIAFACGTIDVALNLVPILRFILMMFGGLFINYNTIPIWMSWIQYLSWFYYSYEILLVNQWEYIDKIECSQFSPTNSSSTACFKNGKEVISFFKFDYSNLLPNFLILISFSIILRVCGFLMFYLRSRHKKPVNK